MALILGDDEPAGTSQPATSAPARPPVQIEGMWDLEREHPGLMAVLYVAAMLFGLLGHHVIGWISQLFGAAT